MGGQAAEGKCTLAGTKLVDTLLVTAAFECRAQERFDAFLGDDITGRTSAQRQDIRVIVLPAQTSTCDVMHEGAADVCMTVGGDRNADA